jgi:hypothetical protein
VDDFEGVKGMEFLSPIPGPESFGGVRAAALLPEAITPDTFRGVKAEALLPEPVETGPFEGVMGGSELQMEFPGGGKVFVSYETGVPLGAEKPVLEPKARRTKPAESED